MGGRLIGIVGLVGLVGCGASPGDDASPAETDPGIPEDTFASVGDDTDTDAGGWTDTATPDTDISGETGFSRGSGFQGFDTFVPPRHTGAFDTGVVGGADSSWVLDLFGLDADGDGFHDALPPAGVPAGNDCDDQDPFVHPGALEIWYDDVDQACNGGSDWDQDRDGHELVGSPLGGDDCNDLLANVSPDVPERCDGFDDDCDGLIDDDDPDLLADWLAHGGPVWGGDGDGDGFLGVGTLVASCGAPPPGLTVLYGQPDCDDGDTDVHPWAADPVGDQVDQDCDGVDG